MVDIVVLQDTLNPISAQERVKINENWDALRRGFSSLQNQINFLSGGSEVDIIVARIEQAIQDAQTNTQNAIDNVNNNYAEKLVEIDQSLGDLASALTNTQTATAEANVARDNAISATSDAQVAITNVLAIVNEFRAVGEWNTTTNYKRNNLVSFDGQTYIALVDNVNIPLTNTSTWSLFAAKGSKGDKGDTGETGAALSIQGSLTDVSQLPVTGSAGQAYTVNGELYVWSENTGEWENVGNIKGEKGDRGERGERGEKGEAGQDGADADLTEITQTVTDLNSEVTTHLDENNVNAHGVSNIVGLQSELDLKANKKQEAWINPVLLNGWTGNLQFYKDEFNVIHLRGMLNPPNPIANGSIFNFPEGYRTNYGATQFPPVTLVTANGQQSFGIYHQNNSLELYGVYPTFTQIRVYYSLRLDQ